jgi:hypothetical protein
VAFYDKQLILMNQFALITVIPTPVSVEHTELRCLKSLLLIGIVLFDSKH